MEVTRAVMSCFGLRRFRIILAVLATLLIHTGCIKNTKSVLKNSSGDLTIFGTVVDDSGTPMPGIEFYVGQSEEIVGTTNGSGAFQVAFNSDQLLIKKGLSSFGKDAFYVYFNNPRTGQVGISGLISFQERGPRNLGNITMTASKEVSGVVKFLPVGRGLENGAGAVVSIGHQRVLARADGSFSVSGIPQGQVPLSVSAKGYVPHFTIINTALGFNEPVLDGPLVLFTEFGISGTLIPVPLSSNEIKNRHEPFSREFLSRASKHSKWIRYHHDLAVLATPTPGSEAPRTEGPEGTEPAVPEASRPTDLGDFWYVSGGRFQYNFPGGGGQFLFYQYANEERTEFSPIYQVSLDVNVFHDTKGVIIGDGSGRTDSAKVKLSIDLPAAANRMRISESNADIISQPWRATQSEMEYIFRPTAERDQLGRTIFVQFVDAFGNESAVYSSSVELELFKTVGPMVEDGTGRINRPFAFVNLNTPKEATTMRYGDNLIPIEEQPWVEAEDSIRHIFTAVPDALTSMNYVSGERRFQVQYQDAYGFVSPVFEESVHIEMFPVDNDVFTINSGAEVSQLKTVFLDIDVPQNAYEMRVFAADTGANVSFDVSGRATSITEDERVRTLWLRARPFYSFTFKDKGSKDLFVQFRDPNGFVSSLFKQTIDIQPFSSDRGQGGFVINNGAAITASPLLFLDISVPEQAIFMGIQESEAPDDRFREWQAVSNQDTISVSGRGLKEVFLRFMNADQSELSEAFRQEIFYEPFPWSDDLISINQGAFITVNRLVDIAIYPPENAVAMRIHHDPAVLVTQPWENIQAYRGYELPDDVGLHRVYVQFRNATDDESLLFSDEILLERSDFTAPADIITINNGDAETDSEFVIVSMNLPDDAVEFRIAEDPGVLSGLPWLSAVDEAPLRLSDEDGVHSVFMQFRKDDGQESALFFDSIVLNNPTMPVFTVADNIIVINSGDDLTEEPEVMLALNLPPESVEFRVAESPAVLAALPWVSNASAVPFTLIAQDGVHTVYLQVRNSEGEESGLFFDSIELDQPLDPGFNVPDDIIVINNGDAVADDFQVTLQLNLPEDAVAVRVGESQSGLASQPFLGAVSTIPFNLAQFEGVHTVYLQFATESGGISTLYFDSIILDLPTPSDFEVSDDIIRINNNDALTETVAVTLSFDLPDEAVEIRVNEDPTVLVGLPWINATDTMPFNLAGIDGVHNVFLQYRTEDQLESPIFFDSIILDTPGDLNVTFPEDIIELNGGDTVTEIPEITVSLNLPTEAVAFRLANDLGSLGSQEWLSETSSAPFTLPSEDGTHTVYMQYRTVQDLVSPAFFAAIVLDIPNNEVDISDDIILINNDDVTTEVPEVTLTFNLPGEAVDVRFVEDSTLIGGSAFVSTANLTSMPITLTETNGIHTIYMQYRTEEGELSPLFFDSIVLDLPDDEVVIPEDIILVNSGDATAAEVNVTLSFNLPEEAVRVRFSEDPGFGGTAWFNATESVPFTLEGTDGLHTVYLIYQTEDDQVSPVFFDTIVLDQPEDESVTIPDDIITVNDGDPTTTSRDVTLDFNLPSEAVEIRFSIDTGFTDGWFDASTAQNVPFTLPETDGIHTVYMIYRTADGQVSPIFFDSIVLDQPEDETLEIPDDIITINVGDVMTESRDVTLTFNLPAEATQVRFSESISFASSAWFNASTATTVPFTLSEEDGIHTVYMIYQTADGQVSPLFFDSIILDQPDEPDFSIPENIITINNGDNISTSRSVSLVFDLPSEAVMVRFGEGSDLSGATWYSATSEPIPFTMSDGDGVHMVNAQYRTLDGQVSPFFFDSIVLDLPEDVAVTIPPAMISINNGAETTTANFVNLNLDLPAEAVEVRFSESTTAILSMEWLAPAEVIPFVLQPVEGGHIVYLQYRTAQGISSPFFFDSIELEFPEDENPVLPDATISINNDAATTSTTLVDLILDLPPEAIEVRFSESTTDILSESWISPAASIPFVLDATEGGHIVYLQYRTIAGVTSPFFFDSIDLELPDENAPLPSATVEINGGAATTTTALVDLGLTLPPEAAEVRFSESSETITSQSWISAAASLPFVLEATNGTHIVYMQYRTAGGEESPFFLDSIELDLPDPDPLPVASFVINGGDATATSTLVDLMLTLPPEAVEVRFSEDNAAITSLPWLSPLPTMSFILSETEGEHIVYLQYRTAGGEESSIVLDNINLDLP